VTALSPWYQALDRHAPRLDGLRGIAILLVVLYHTCRYPLATTPGEQAFITVVSMGWMGVDLFFVLSGFLITSILVRQRESPSYFRTFYARRVIRIFPLYYAALVLFLYVLPPLTGNPEGFWTEGSDRETLWYWLFLSNFQNAFTGNWQHHFLEVTWSLAIEEQFYLFWPLLVWTTSRAGLVKSCVAIMVGSLALRLAVLWIGAPNDQFLYTFTPCRLDELAAGALVAVLAADPARLAMLSRIARPLFGASLAVFVGIVVVERLRIGEILAAAPAASPKLAASLYVGWTTSPFIQGPGFTLLALAGAALVVRAMAAEPASLLARFLESRALRIFGKYSFALYLLHVLGGEIASAIFHPDRFVAAGGGFLAAQFGYWAAVLVCSMALSLLSWVALESPFHRLRRFVPYRQREDGG
jgi:peptidoglycan/LPS O-acetylase OafA/YrhL